jgi:hypothetical protein
MSAQEYSVHLLTVFDPNADTTFRIEPPVKFITEEARQSFGQNVIDLISRRADYGEMSDAKVEITHDSADGAGTIGYARIPALKYGTGREVFLQGLLLALNGEHPSLYSYKFVARP